MNQFASVFLGLCGLSTWAFAQQAPRAVLDAPVVISPSHIALQHLGQVNADGLSDYIGWSLYDFPSQEYRSLTVYGYPNVGQGQLGNATWQVSVIGMAGVVHAPHTAVGDLNADGFTDVVAVCDGVLKAFASTDNGALNYATWNIGRELTDLALFDLDGDNRAELIYREVTGLIKVHRNSGSALEPTPASNFQGGTSSGMLRVGDLSGDGVADLLLTQVGNLRIQKLQASGALAEAFDFSTSPDWNKPRPVIGDIDGDGDNDAAVFCGAVPNAQYHVLRTQGPSAWVLEPAHAGGPATELADLDGDGDLDGMCCGGGGGYYNEDYLQFAEPSVYHLTTNDGSGNFAPSFQMWGLGSNHIAGAADMDADGDQDLVAGRAIYLARGSIGPPVYSAISNATTVAGNPSDVDSDGDVDLGLSPQGALVQDGSGVFINSALSLPAAGVGASFEGPGYAGDWDGDGDVDLIVARFDGGTFTAMNLMRNRGAGVFDDAGACASFGEHFSLTGATNLDPKASFVADLQGDGDMDLITRTWFPDEPDSRVWLNDGNGQFSKGSAIELGQYKLNSMAVADLIGGDGIPDVVAAHAVGIQPMFRVFRGNPDGTFAHWTDFSGILDSRRDRIAVLDQDYDGDLDVVAPHQDDPFVSLYLNQNEDYFQGTLIPGYDKLQTAKDSDRFAHALDVDGNGIVDLVVGPAIWSKNAVHIALRDGSPQQGPVYTQVLPANHWVDIDGDGDIDTVVDTPIGGGAWVRNLMQHGPAAGARQQYGYGSAGNGGLATLLGADGPFRVGEQAQLRVSGGSGGASGIIAVGSQPAELINSPYAGMTGWVWPVSRRLPFTLSAGGAGEGRFALEFQVPPTLAGTTVYYQAYVFDSKAPNGLACSNGQKVSYGIE